MLARLKKLFYDEDGIEMVEYGLVFFFGAIIIIFGIVMLQCKLMDRFFRIAHVVDVARKGRGRY